MFLLDQNGSEKPRITWMKNSAQNGTCQSKREINKKYGTSTVKFNPWMLLYKLQVGAKIKYDGIFRANHCIHVQPSNQHSRLIRELSSSHQQCGMKKTDSHQNCIETGCDHC